MKRNAIAPWSRRLTALLLVLFMVVSMIPMTALATEPGPDPPAAEAEPVTEPEPEPQPEPEPEPEPHPITHINERSRSPRLVSVRTLQPPRHAPRHRSLANKPAPHEAPPRRQVRSSQHRTPADSGGTGKTRCYVKNITSYVKKSRRT